jgi:predicted CXXCH cytochrome family protein
MVAVAAIVVVGARGAAHGEAVDCKMCHPEKAEGASVHPAVSMMGCESCHTGVLDTSVFPHKFAEGNPKGLMAQGADLCYACHDRKSYAGKTNVHMPVAGGMCTACHNPHASAEPRLLQSKDICFTCHDKGSFAGGLSDHVPAAEGSCTLCHSPHQSDIEKLLLSEVPDLCYTCHDRAKFYGPVIHAPVGIGLCTACHVPHKSENEHLLNAKKQDLCYACHDKTEFAKRVTHKPVVEGECGACHYPHAGQNRSLLYRRGNLLCRKCHPDIERAPHAIAGFKATGHPVRGRKDPNRPGRTFGCESCHVPHSSNSIKLFRYKATDRFDLCMNCHEQ